jgi:Galactose oxidase, central domain
MTTIVGGADRVTSRSRTAALLSALDRRLGLRRRAAQNARARVAAAPGTNPGWVPTADMLYAVYGHTATLLADGRVLIAGGSYGVNATQFAQIYDPNTSRWAHTGPMWNPRYFHTATLMPDGSVLVAGGYPASPVGGDFGGDFDYPAPLTATERYDPATGRWHQVTDMNDGHAHHTATLLSDGRVVAAAGARLGGFPIGFRPHALASNLFEIYEPAHAKWRAVGDIGDLRFGHTATQIGENVLVYGGNAAERYSGTDGYVQTASDSLLMVFGPLFGGIVAEMWCDRAFHTATALADGTVLIVGGGQTGWRYPPNPDIPNLTDHAPTDLRYDPAGDPTDPHTTAAVSPRRLDHTATALTDGRVLVAGGLHIDDGTMPDDGAFTIAAGHTLADALLYQPGNKPNGTWSTARNMIDDRRLHTATLLSDGSVLVSGGLQESTAKGTRTVLGTAEVFYPNLPDLSGCNPLLSSKPAVVLQSAFRSSALGPRRSS